MTDTSDTPDKGFFDRISEVVDEHISRAWFFAFCAGLVLAWLLQGVTFRLWLNDTWHLELNSPTTAMTFLMVALGANSARRAWTALHKKMDAQSKALRAVMVHLRSPKDDADFDADIRALEEAVGLEADVGTKKGSS